MPSSIRSTQKSNFFLDSSGEQKLQEFNSVKYFESGQQFFLTNLQIHPEYFTGEYDILPNYGAFSDNLYIVKDNFEITKSDTEERYIWLDSKYDNILNQTGVRIDNVNRNLLHNSGFLFDPNIFVNPIDALFIQDGLSSTDTIYDKNTSFFPDFENQNYSFAIAIKADKNSSGAVFEFGGLGNGAILYAYNGYLYFTAGDGSSFETTNNSVEVSGKLPDNFSTIHIAITASRDNHTKLFFNNVLIDSGIYIGGSTTDYLFGSNDGSVNDPRGNVPANRGGFGTSDGIETISSGQIVSPLYLYQDQYINSTGLNFIPISGVPFFEDFSNIQNSGEQTGIIYSVEKFGNLPVDPYLGSGEIKSPSDSVIGIYQTSLLNSGAENLNSIFGVRNCVLFNNIFIGEFSGIFSSGSVYNRNTGDYNASFDSSSGMLDFKKPENTIDFKFGWASYPPASYDLSGESDTDFVSGGNLPLTFGIDFKESGMLPNEVLYYEPTQKLMSEYTGSGTIYHPFPYFPCNLIGESGTDFVSGGNLPLAPETGFQESGMLPNEVLYYEPVQQSTGEYAGSGMIYHPFPYFHSTMSGAENTYIHPGWVDLAPSGSIENRRAVAGAIIGDYIYIFGGKDAFYASTPTDTTFRYDINNNFWEEIFSLPKPEARFFADGCSDGSSLYIFGGIDANNDRLNDLWKFDTTIGPSGEWIDITPTGTNPPARQHPTLQYFSGALYLSHGRNGASVLQNDTWRYDINSGFWEELIPSGSYTPVRNHHSALINNKIYVFFGFDGSSYINSMDCYDIIDNSWSQIIQSGNVPSPRGYGACFAYNDRIFLIGGYISSSINDCYVFNTNTNFWEKIIDFPYTIRHNFADVTVSGDAYNIGGYDGSNTLNNTHKLPNLDYFINPQDYKLTGSYTPSGSYILESDVLILPSGV